MKKFKFLFVLVLVSAVTCPSLNNKGKIIESQIKGIRFDNYVGDVSEVFSGSIAEFKDAVYDNIKGSKQIGKYYKVGLFGHHQVVEFGESMSLKTRELEKISEFYGCGTLNNITLTKEVTYSLTKQVTTTHEVKVGVTKIIDAAINLLDIAKVGTETKATASYKFEQTTLYSETLTNTFRIATDFNLDNLLPNKKRFCISRIALFMEVPIKKSYTEESKWGKWTTLGSTLVEDYVANFYIDDVITFGYEDRRFGEKVMGEYDIDNTIQSF